MDIKHLKPALLIIGMLLFSSGMADEGEQLFKTNCAACHSIGKGRLVGPDLNNISSKRSQEWLISFIKSPTALINSGDADAIAVFEEYNKLLMPDYSYSDAQIKGILAYIDQSGTASNEASASPAVDILDGTTSENIDKGLLLFSGNQGFSNGGAACNSCHNVRDDRIFSSGTLAKDLSETFEVMGSAGIAAIIKNPPFPVMTIT
jgi:mono/diheme cytochrome c family protein